MTVNNILSYIVCLTAVWPLNFDNYENNNNYMYLHRTNLELELVHRGGNLCSGGASAAAKRSCLSECCLIICM